MTARLVLIWDYDTAIGQINATYPYTFNEEKIFQEIQNVDFILDFAFENKIQMTFACLGFAAEPGQYPYHVPDQIKKIYQMGHEVASHSWRHEWFPYLERKQIERSLARSKEALEACIGVVGAVKGFVPPFNRPMTWYQKGAISLGDRAFGLQNPGAHLDSLLEIVHQAGYAWCRVHYRAIWRKFLEQYCGVERNLNLVQLYKNVHCIPGHVGGFDSQTLKFVDAAINTETVLFVVSHPSGLSRDRNESLGLFNSFMKIILEFRAKGQLDIMTVDQHLRSLNK